MNERDPVPVNELVRRNVRKRRDMAGLSAQILGERCQAIGVALDRNAISAFETGRRAKLSVEEVMGLAVALEVTALTLVNTIDDAPVLVGDLVIDAETWGDWVSGALVATGTGQDLEFLTFATLADRAKQNYEDQLRENLGSVPNPDDLPPLEP